MHLACDLLHSYLGRESNGPIPSDARLAELTEGNVLTADALTGIIAGLLGSTFDQVLDELPERDEGYPPDPVAMPKWDTTIDQLKYLHSHDSQDRRATPRAHDMRTAFRSWFNLVVALNNALAAATNSTPQQAARLLRDAAAADT